MEETLRLFKALPIESKKGDGTPLSQEDSKELFTQTIKRGFVFSPEVVANYSHYDRIIELVEQEIGLTPEQLNSTFHKSWTKVKDAPMLQLVMEQMIHYLTTYGFKRMGIYDENSVYIPSEELDVPGLEESKLTLTVIHGYTVEELKEKLLKLLGTGIALAEQTVKDCVTLGTYLDFTEEDIDNIKNKEVKVSLYTSLGKVPSNAVEFLRYAVHSATGKTLLIKDGATLAQIKENTENPNFIVDLFARYQKKNGLTGLAEVFYRFKPIFLAFRANKRIRPLINKVRRMAKTCHKPMKVDYLNSVTAMIKNGESIDVTVLTKELSKVNTFRKIRLAYALKYRTNETADSILYKIRNGKGYATTFNFANKTVAQRILTVVEESIVEDLQPNVKGKKVYIPSNINYTLPATEKQFTGAFPNGTYVSVPRDMVFGVHWNDVSNYTVDLDLSLINAEGQKFGWDASYRSEGRDILFSGDITAAPNGATELFYIGKQNEAGYILMCNYFNYSETNPVPFKIIVAQEPVTRLTKNYTVNPNNVACVVNTKIDKKQRVLGLVITRPDECRFYFTGVDMGNSISSSNMDHVQQTRKYMFDFYNNMISLSDLLERAGAEVVSEVPEDLKVGEVYIDLSPEKLEKDTIINLLTS